MHTFRTKDNVLTLLIHLNYLGYEPGDKGGSIPSKQIAGEFENAMRTGGWVEIMRVSETHPEHPSQ